MNEQTATLGDNLAPDDDFDDLRQRVEDLTATANRWLTERPEITDEEMAGKASDFMEQVNKSLRKVEAERKEKKQPHIDAGKAVDGRYNPLKAPLQKIKDLLEPRIRAWLKAKEERIAEEKRQAEEEALKAMQEAEDAKKAAEAAEGDVIGNAVAAEEAEAKADEALKEVSRVAQPARAKGDYGQRATGLRTVYRARVTDALAVLTHCYRRGNVADVDAIVELAERLASAHMRATKGTAEIPGAEPVTERKAV